MSMKSKLILSFNALLLIVLSIYANAEVCKRWDFPKDKQEWSIKQDLQDHGSFYDEWWQLESIGNRPQIFSSDFSELPSSCNKLHIRYSVTGPSDIVTARSYFGTIDSWKSSDISTIRRDGIDKTIEFNVSSESGTINRIMLELFDSDDWHEKRIFIDKVIIYESEPYEWEPPNYVLISQNNSISSKLVKAGNYVYVVNANQGVLSIFTSTDLGKTYVDNHIIGSDVQKSLDYEIIVDPEGTVYLTYLQESTQDMIYRKFNHQNKRTSDENEVSITYTTKAVSCNRPSPLFPALSACLINNPKTLLYLYIFCNKDKEDYDLYLHTLTNPLGSDPFENSKVIQITDNDNDNEKFVKELNPKIKFYKSSVFVTYFVFNSNTKSYSIFLAEGLNNGTSWKKPAKQVNRHDHLCTNIFDFIIDPYGTIYIAYVNAQNDGDIFIARSIDSGNSFDYFRVSDDNSGFQAYPSLFYHSKTLYTGWVDKRNGSREVYLTISRDGGESYEKNFRLTRENDNQVLNDIFVDDYGKKDGTSMILCFSFKVSTCCRKISIY